MDVRVRHKLSCGCVLEHTVIYEPNDGESTNPPQWIKYSTPILERWLEGAIAQHRCLSTLFQDSKHDSFRKVQ